MAAPVLDFPRPIDVRVVADRRPPAVAWLPAPAPVPQPNQPMLIFDPSLLPLVAEGSATRSPDEETAARLPDARGWAAPLARAMFEALHGRRPIGQLTRWVDEAVLAAIGFHQRSQARARGLEPARPAPAARLHSLRIQRPNPLAAEVCAHLSLGPRSAALAFRLEGRNGRWLCVALEFA